MGFSGEFDSQIGLCVVKGYDMETDSAKLLETFEMVGTLQWEPLSEKEEEDRLKLIEANGYVPGNEFTEMPKYPVLHAIARIPDPVSLLPENLESQFSNLDLNAVETCHNKLKAMLKGICSGDELAA